MFQNKKPLEKIKIAKSKKIDFINGDYFIFPFSLKLGYINQGETGNIGDNTIISDYATFKRVFTGLTTLIALWDGAYSYKKINDNDLYITKKYKVGNWFKGNTTDKQQGTEFINNSIDNSFLNQINSSSITITTNKEITETDLFKFYIIPELKQEKFLYIESVKNYYTDKNKFNYAEITFSSVKQQLEQSGQAIEQYIHRNPAGGEGYAWPNIIDNKVYLDDIKKLPTPITSAQIEINGATNFYAFYCEGRPIKRNPTTGQPIFNEKIEAPRRLLAYKVLTPTPSPLNTKQNVQTDYFVTKGRPTLEKNINNWKKYYGSETRLNAEEENSYNGFLEITDKNSIVKNTNPLVNGSYSKIISNNEDKVEIDEAYNTYENKLTSNNINLKGKYTYASLINHFSFINNKVNVLPLSLKNNVMWNLEDLPLIGGFLSTLTLGIPLGWKDTKNVVKMESMPFLIPCSIFEYMNERIKKTGDTENAIIDLNVFLNKDNDNKAKYLGLNNMGCVLKIALTDKFTKSGRTFYTSQLGQSKNADGTNIYADGSKLLWDENCLAIPPDQDAGYIVDAIVDKILSSSDVRYTLYSGEYDAWNGTYQTKAKFSNNIRNITNIRKLSNIKEDEDKVVKWPEKVILPTPGDSATIINIDEWEKNYNSTFNQNESFKFSNSSDNKYIFYNTLIAEVDWNSNQTNYWETNLKLTQIETLFSTKKVGEFKLSDYSPSDTEFFNKYKNGTLEIDNLTWSIGHLKRSKDFIIWNDITANNEYIFKIKGENDSPFEHSAYFKEFKIVYNTKIGIKYTNGLFELYLTNSLNRTIPTNYSSSVTIYESFGNADLTDFKLEGQGSTNQNILIQNVKIIP